ncbi:hypothetical protein ACHAWO_000844 [Cyclotella atomus]|uniref:HMG box domain-containing protein n=1 Tax=Cyclotella atomus TaxID=382360 RepID=A0ABD3MZC7_9STRA
MSNMSARRPARDPMAPKRNMSAYLLYQNAMRDSFKSQNPGMTFGQLSKYTSAMYAEMPAEEKEAWNARAEADKARYLHELATYVPPPGYDVKGDALSGHLIQPQGRARKTVGMGHAAVKTVRDPSAPRRNMSAYLLYQNCMRETFKSMNPGMTFGQLAKFTSHMYKCLSVEEKARWEAHAAQDKARFEAEMASYVPPVGYDQSGNLIEDRSSMHKKYQKKVKDPEQPKRARGSFVFFTFDERPKVMAEFPELKFVEMGTLLGERWRNLPQDEKQKYEDLAAEDKARFNKEMEEYTANRVAQEPPQLMVPDTQAQWQQQYAMAAGQQAMDHAGYYAHYAPQAAEAYAHYDPSQMMHHAHMDPYAHAAYQQQYGHYHYG